MGESERIRKIRAKILEQLRRESMTKKALADRMEIGATNLIKMLGKSDWNPKLSTLERLAAALGIPLNELIFPDVDPSTFELKKEKDENLIRIEAKIQDLQAKFDGLPNLPANIVRALQKVSKKSQVDLLETLLAGMGLFRELKKKASGE